MTPASPPDLSRRADCNAARTLDCGATGGYESFFQRANHPHRPLAFWIRYTLITYANAARPPLAELWAVFFDGESGRITAVKESHPLPSANVDRERFSVRIGSASLEQDSLRGAAVTDGRRIAWALDYRSPEDPLLLLPESLYRGGFPKAKSLVGSPNAVFDGALDIDGRTVDVRGWAGSQNHNWGVRHTDRYAWGQVAGFDGEPSAFLECATAQLRMGPVWTPRMTVVVLRLDGEELRLNSIPTALRAKAQHDGFEWRFETHARGVRVRGVIAAPAERFVALRYDNPPGGHNICLNSKLASCELVVSRPGHTPRTLRTCDRAAFELLGPSSHGLPIVV